MVYLAQPHLVGENAVNLFVVQKIQPVEAYQLVGLQPQSFVAHIRRLRNHSRLFELVGRRGATRQEWQCLRKVSLQSLRGALARGEKLLSTVVRVRFIVVVFIVTVIIRWCALHSGRCARVVVLHIR